MKPATMQVLEPEDLGGRPTPARAGPASRHSHPSGTRPHAQTSSPEGGWGCSERQEGGQAGEGRLRHSDAGALQQQDAACHQIGDAQAEQQHLSPLQQAVQPVEGHPHTCSVYSHSPRWKAIPSIRKAISSFCKDLQRPAVGLLMLCCCPAVGQQWNHD